MRNFSLFVILGLLVSCGGKAESDDTDATDTVNEAGDDVSSVRPASFICGPHRGLTITLDEVDLVPPSEGDKEHLSASYRVHGTDSQPLSCIQVINQPYGEGTEPQSTAIIERVMVTCMPDAGVGGYSFFEASLVDGVALFDKLSCADDSEAGLVLKVMYDVALGAEGEFRLVLDEAHPVDSQEAVPTRILGQ